MSFANTAGGILLIGVEDKTKRIVGLSDPLTAELQLANSIADSIQPRISPDIYIVSVGRHNLLAVEVHSHSFGPVFIKSEGSRKGVYIRIGSTNRIADEVVIAQLKRQTLNQSYDEEVLSELNSEEIDFTVVSEQFAEFRVMRQADFLTLGLVRKVQNHIVPTVGGILLFGKRRLELFPDAWIQVGAFYGEDRSRILDSKELVSYPVITLEEALSFLKRHLSVSSNFTFPCTWASFSFVWIDRIHIC